LSRQRDATHRETILNLRELLLSLLLVTTVGCDSIASKIEGLKVSRDPLVGTWRTIGDDTGGTMTFDGDGSYRVNLGRMDPASDKAFIAAMRAIMSVAGKYSRGTNTLVLTMDVKGVREAAAGLPKHGPDTLRGDKLDIVYTYVLGGDILEMTYEGKTSKLVRVK
jgi:hypothetical protein